MTQPEIEIRMDEPGARALMRELHRANESLGKPLRQSIQWAGYFVARSLGARTKVSKKLRPVVRPFVGKQKDMRYKTDLRHAPWGVPVYKNGVRTFKPIGRTGYSMVTGNVAEDIVIRFRDKKTAEYAGSKDRRGRQWHQLATGAPDPADPSRTVPGIMQDRRRKIGRRGLAKRSWSVIQRNIPRGGIGSPMGVLEVSSVRWRGGKMDPVLRIRNDLRYAMDALRGGEGAVDEAMGAASRAMMNRVHNAIMKKLRAK